MNTIGQNIAEFRKERGLTQEELAEKMCVTAQAVSKWERDASYPDVTALSTLAKVLGVSVADIIEGTQNVPKLKEADEDVIAHRIMHIKAHLDEMDVELQFPVVALRKMIDNGALKMLLDKDEYPEVVSALNVVDTGLVGQIVKVNKGDTKIVIEVEEYAG